MKYRVAPAFLVIFALFASLVCYAEGSTRLQIVMTESGAIEGASAPDNPHLTFFRGIPYAAPPVGELRWKPPQAPVPWKSVRKAVELSAACPQPDFMYRGIQRSVARLGGDPSSVKPVGRTSEDCLYLNVITTAPNTKAHRPVMVWIHGGGGEMGRGGDEGATLAIKGVVVVTINYRLGVFGWLSLQGLTAESKHQSSGDYGLLDQIAALQWVRRNISQFGGDPANVTIFGQSSGGEYVGCLMVSPLARGLFQRAIMQSGTPLDLLASVHNPGGEVESAQARGVELAHKLGVGNDADTIGKLRLISTDDLLRLSANAGFDAVVDGWVLPEQPLVMFAHQMQADVPLIVGSTAREFGNLIGPQERTPKMFRAWVRQSFAPIADDVLSRYAAPTPATARDAFIRASTDLEMSGPARWAAESMRGMKSKAYLYEITWSFSSEGGWDLGACHGIDLMLMFDYPPVPRDATGDALAKGMRDYWVNFATTGNPNRKGLPRWPYYDSSTASYLDLGANIAPEARPYPAAFALINKLYAARLRSLEP